MCEESWLAIKGLQPTARLGIQVYYVFVYVGVGGGVDLCMWASFFLFCSFYMLYIYASVL